MLLSSFGLTNFGINDRVSILIIANTHFLILFVRCKTLTLRLELWLMLLLLLYFRNVLECGKTRSLHEELFCGIYTSKKKNMDMCFYVQHCTNVLYILVCYIFMPSKFLTVINKTLKNTMTTTTLFHFKQKDSRNFDNGFMFCCGVPNLAYTRSIMSQQLYIYVVYKMLISSSLLDHKN